MSFEFNKHRSLEGTHAYLSPSQHSWLNYSDDKMREVYENQLMKQRLREIAEQRRSAGANRAQVSAPVPATQRTTSSARQSAASSSPAKLGTYTVKSGDTLIGISRKIYGSPRYYKLIADANKGVIPANMQLRVGQVIRIPQLPARSR